MNKKLIINLFIVEICGTYYQVCLMNINTSGEFFFHPTYPKDLKNKKVFNYILNKRTGLLDHISFHKDGNVHLKLKSGERIGDRAFFDGAFIPMDKNAVTPLLVHSIYQHEGKYMLSETEGVQEGDNLNIRQSDFLFSRPQNFSVILFLTPDEIDLEGTFFSIYRVPLSFLGRVAG